MIQNSINPACLTEIEQNAIQLFVDRVLTAFPEQIVSILLFGSRVRGDAKPDSDMDILVIMTNTNLEIQRMIRNLAMETWLTHGIYLSTRIWSQAHQNQHAAIHSSFYRNIQHDAIDLLAASFAR